MVVGGRVRGAPRNWKSDDPMMEWSELTVSAINIMTKLIIINYTWGFQGGFIGIQRPKLERGNSMTNGSVSPVT